MQVYRIERVASRAAFDKMINSREAFDLALACAPWGAQYRPDTCALVRHDGHALHVAMRSYEQDKDIRAQVQEHDGPVHTDSCMEFFFSPCPALRPDYFNMEMNPSAFLKLHYGPARAPRVDTVSDPALFEAKGTRGTDAQGSYWQLVYTIPFAHIARWAPAFTGAAGSEIRANLYKCAEDAPRPHYLTAYMIDTKAYPNPDYHRPEYFAPMVLL